MVGAGAVGLTLAGRLAQLGANVTVFEASASPRRTGSRAICMQRETLETWARLGIGEQVAERGVRWNVGRTWFRGRELFRVELPMIGPDHFPPFVNISQSEVEEMLEARVRALGVHVERGTRLDGFTTDSSGVDATFSTATGEVSHRFGYLVGADGAHSVVRHAARLSFDGSTFDDRFLIADIRADLPFTNERHFHFDPPWNPGRQVLIHPQPDGVWRIDWQVPSGTDVDAERASGRLDARIRAVVGAAPYDLIWLTAYRFSQRVAPVFRSGRILLAGDAAHVMSPFGARGLNSGIADAENLAWKLADVAAGRASQALLDTYDVERRGAALENLAATAATMRFMAPHGPLRRAWRDIVLRLAPHSAWFRRRVNSGRLAEPAVYAPSSVVAATPDRQDPAHGRPAPDARLPDGTRLRAHLGAGAVLVGARRPRALGDELAFIELGDETPYGHRRAWLIRPDGYLAASAPLADAPALSSGWSDGRTVRS